MPVSFEKPSPVDITKFNPTSKHYVTTDNTKVIPADNDPNGSIRIIFTPGETEAHIEAKANGVYNDTGFRFSSGSVNIGRDMIVSAVAGHLETRNPSAAVGHVNGLIPHIEFSDAGTIAAETPIVKAEEDFVVYSGAVSEIIGTTIGINLAEIPSRIIEFSIHDVGSVPSSAPVTVKFFTGTDNTGFLFNERKLAANALVASSITATTIAFVDSNPDTITDTGNGFISGGFVNGGTIRVSGSTSNDGFYTIDTVTAGTITLVSVNSLTTESAGASVTINSTLSINYDNDLGFEGGVSVFMELTSSANFSLKTDSGGNPLTTHEAHELGEVGILTENLMIDEDFNFMFDLSLNPVYAIQFP